MATGLVANVAILAALASLGFGLLLTIIGLLSAQRIKSSKLNWVSAGFFLLAMQGGLFALRIRDDPFVADEVLIPSLLGLFALFTLYVAVYRRP